MGRKGWGVYSVDPIRRGAFVVEYTGELLPVGEAGRRVKEYDRRGTNYVLATQEFFQGVSGFLSFTISSFWRLTRNDQLMLH